MRLCGGRTTSCEDEKKINDSERDSGVVHAVRIEVEPDITATQCDSKSNVSHTNKKKRKRQKEKNFAQDDQNDGQVDAIKDGGAETNSCRESVADVSVKNDLNVGPVQELSKTRKKKKKKRKKQKLLASAVDVKTNDQVDIQEHLSSLKDAFSKRNSILESLVDADEKNDLNTTLVQELSKSQKKNLRKKLRKKLKLGASAVDNVETNDQVDVQGDTSSIKDDSGKTNSIPKSVVDTNEKNGLNTTPVQELSKSQRKKLRKKQKLGASAVDNIETIGQFETKDQVDVQGETPSIKNDLGKTNSSQESVVDINEMNGLNTTPVQELSKSQRKNLRKKLRKKQKLLASADGNIETNDQVDVQGDMPSIKNDLGKTNSIQESVVDINEKNGLNTTPVQELSKLQRKNLRTKLRKKQKLLASADGNIGTDSQVDVQGDMPSIKNDLGNTNSIQESVVDINENNGLNTTPVQELSKSQRKNLRTKLRKKQKLLASADGNTRTHDQVDVQGDASSIKENSGRTNLIQESVVDTGKENDLNKAPLQELSNSGRKRIRKMQKQNASVVDDKAHVPFAELDVKMMNGNASMSEQKTDSLGIPSGSSMAKHNNNGQGGLLLVERENFKISKMKENLKTNKRRKKVSADSEENVNPETGIGKASSDSNRMHSSAIAENVVGIVQKGEPASLVKAVEDVITEKISSKCSTGDYKSNKIIEMNKDIDLDVHMGGNFQVSKSPTAGLHIPRTDKKLLILDINGLLVDILPYGQTSKDADAYLCRKSVFRRPFCDDFLQFCFENFIVGVWSSRTKRNMDTVLKFIMGKSVNKLAFSWHQSHCTETGFTTLENSSKPLVFKELKKLWDKVDPRLPWNKGEYNESNTLLLDDSPYKALCNPPNTAIFPHSYSYKNAGDSSLGPGGDLRSYLELLAKAINVPDFVAQNPFGQGPIKESNPSWGFYQKCIAGASMCPMARFVGAPIDRQ